MEFRIIDTESAYRRLMASTDAAERQRIFCDDLAAPFEGLGRMMGNPDPIAAFKQWGMTPDLYADAHWPQTLETLAANAAWQRAADSLERAKSAFAPHMERIPLLGCDRIGLGEIVF